MNALSATQVLGKQVCCALCRQNQTRLNDIPWTYFNTDGSPDTSITPSVGDTVLDDDFKEYQFSASSLPEFTSFQVKCVMNGLVSSYPPRLKDLRAIALAV